MITDDSRTCQLVWINGAFGAGKTTVASLLAEKIPGAVIIDPEEVGSLLRPVLQPVAPVHDFQEWSAWRDLVGSTITAVARELPADGPRLMIVPQTITGESYWSQMIGALGSDIEVVPVSLQVEEDEHRRRAERDAAEPGALRWRLAKFGRFGEATWIEDAFTVVDTTELSADAVADEVSGIIERR